MGVATQPFINKKLARNLVHRIDQTWIIRHHERQSAALPFGAERQYSPSQISIGAQEATNFFRFSQKISLVRLVCNGVTEI